MENVDGLLSAVEKNLGPRAFKVLLILIALAAAVTACSIIYTLGLRPILAAFGLKLDLSSAWGVFFLVLQLAGAAAITSTILDAYRRRIAREEIERLLSRSEKLNESIGVQRTQVRSLIQASVDISKTSSEFLAGTELILSSIHDRARDNNLLEPEQLSAISEMIEATSEEAKRCAIVLDELTRGIDASDSALEQWAQLDGEELEEHG